MPKGQSAYHKYPDYRVDLEVSGALARVRVDDQVIAESTRAMQVKETRHDPVVYFPREDVRVELLERTDHQSFCPFKGNASYWSVKLAAETLENAVWSYEDPFDEVSRLKDYMAFWGDRVNVEHPA